MATGYAAPAASKMSGTSTCVFPSFLHGELTLDELSKIDAMPAARLGGHAYSPANECA